MYLKHIQFVKSSSKLSECPVTNLPEYAFLGRSNVGKSSLINFLANRKKLAKISNTPGRTRLINHFLVDSSWYLADLPGYGYAKVSKSERQKFEKLIQQYLLGRENLSCLILLIDSRHEPQKLDLEYCQWLGENHIPFVICFTKADKLSDNQLKKSINNYKYELLKTWEELPSIFISSTVTKTGREELLDFIQKTNELLKSGELN